MVKNYLSECEFCKIFSNTSRLMILESLRLKPLNVNEIINITNLPQSVVSQNLSMMKIRGIVDSKKNGSFVIYTLMHPEILDAFDILKKVKDKIKLNYRR